VQIQTTSSALNNTFDSSAVNLPNGAGTLNGSPLNLAVLAPTLWLSRAASRESADQLEERGRATTTSPWTEWTTTTWA